MRGGPSTQFCVGEEEGTDMPNKTNNPYIAFCDRTRKTAEWKRSYAHLPVPQQGAALGAMYRGAAAKRAPKCACRAKQPRYRSHIEIKYYIKDNPLVQTQDFYGLNSMPGKELKPSENVSNVSEVTLRHDDIEIEYDKDSGERNKVIRYPFKVSGNWGGMTTINDRMQAYSNKKLREVFGKKLVI